MREAIRASQSDVVFLQEVQGESNQHEDVQFEFLADSVWKHHAYGKNAITESGHHGNAILSHFPFESWENFDISTNAWEHRGAMHGVIRWQKKRVHVWCTHLNLLESERKEQADWLIGLIQERVPVEEPLILAGDFNDWRVRLNPLFKEELGLSECFETVHGKSARTFPSLWPRMRLDRIYCRGFEVVAAEIPKGPRWDELSDHSPLCAALELG